MIATLTRRFTSCLICFGVLASAAVIQAAPIVTFENNQPFEIHMPFKVRGVVGQSVAGTSKSWQASGADAVMIVIVPPHGRQQVRLDDQGSTKARVFTLKPNANAVTLVYGERDLGELSWDIFMKPAKPGTEDPTNAPPEKFHAAFAPLPLAFKKTTEGSVFDLWSAEAQDQGLRLKIDLLAYHEGFLDINATLTNQTADEKAKVYAAVVCRWEQPLIKSRSYCYDNRIGPLHDSAESPFRRGEGRHQFTQRGVDWVRTQFKSGTTVAWLNDFAASFTLLDNSTKNTFKQPRYQGANVPQLGQEVQTVGDRLYSVTEIARGNIKSYRDRVAEYALPARGEGVEFSSRLTFRKRGLPDEDVDRTFVGYTSYNEQRKTAEGAEVSFGVKSVRFGTSYFPYSTLGENFDSVKLPGMDREAFWPLAADTVLKWRDFTDDIRRDLRIAKAMGFHFIRLHHLELLARIPADVRQEYLDFLFGEIRNLKLKTLIDIYATDEGMVDLVKRYGDVIDTIELENEILIWGIPLDRPEQWKKTYAAIKQAAPHVRVHLTGYNNTGMFNRLDKLGVPYDRVGLHSYADSLDAIPTTRGYALALASFANKVGKPPVITEWNWRQLTRLTPEARAKIYPPIFENALATRALPEMYQFQFNETLAPNLRSGRGNILRHYELIHLSRRPKLEALEFMKLIRKYTAPDDPTRLLEAPRVVVDLNSKGEGTAVVKLKNTGKQPLRLNGTVESPATLQASAKPLQGLKVKAGGSLSFDVKLKTADLTPGFYHSFVRFESPDGMLRYAWIEARLLGNPVLETEKKTAVNYPRGVKEELSLDFTRPFAVVYGTDAPVLEVETAFAIASTLESATGQSIEMVQLNDLPRASRKPRNLVLVGTPQSNTMIGSILGTSTNEISSRVLRKESPDGETAVIVTGNDSLAVERAGMDLLLRWWKHAKDSATRRVGLVEKEVPRGGDATKLP